MTDRRRSFPQVARRSPPGPPGQGGGRDKLYPTRGGSSLREAVGFLRALRPVDVPATMNTAASVGSSRMGRQSAFIALDTCDGRRNFLPRMEGTSSRISEAPRASRLSGEAFGF